MGKRLIMSRRLWTLALLIAVVATLAADQPASAWNGVAGWSSSGSSGGGGSSGGSGQTYSYVLQPGGTAGGNVYTSWSTLYAAASAVKGGARVVVDDSLGAVHITTGSWNIDQWTFATPASFTNANGGTIINVDDGATFTFGTMTLGPWIYMVAASATTSPVTLATGEMNVYMQAFSAINETGAHPFFNVTGVAASAYLWLHMENSSIGDQTHATIELTSGAGGQINMVSSEIHAAAIQGSGSGFLLFADVSSFVEAENVGVLEPSASRDLTWQNDGDNVPHIAQAQATTTNAGINMTVTAQQGGAGSSSAGANGGELILNGGGGGNGVGTSMAGGNGNNLVLNGGPGGAGSATTSAGGNGGNVSITGGAGGACAGTGTSDTGGAVDIEVGSEGAGCTGSVLASHITIGTNTNAPVDAFYKPTTSSNWSGTAPNRLAGALDTLASHRFVAVLASSQILISTTQTNINTIGAITMAPTDVWKVQWSIYASYSVSANYIAWALNVPTGAAMLFAVCPRVATGGGAVSGCLTTNTSGGILVSTQTASTTAHFWDISATVIGDGTHGGTIQLTGSESTSGDLATVNLGSSVLAMSE